MGTKWWLPMPALNGALGEWETKCLLRILLSRWMFRFLKLSNKSALTTLDQSAHLNPWPPARLKRWMAFHPRRLSPTPISRAHFSPIQLIRWSVQLVSQVASTRLWLSSQATPISSAGQWSISWWRLLLGLLVNQLKRFARQWRRSQATPISSVGQGPISERRLLLGHLVNQLKWLTQVVNHLGHWAQVLPQTLMEPR